MYSESNINHRKYNMTELYKISSFDDILWNIILRDCNESYLEQIKHSFDQFKGIDLKTHIDYPNLTVDLPDLQLQTVFSIHSWAKIKMGY